ncbi:unnamed protein product [Somion occarium]|uniref:DUF6533 domain-containing protein n=1 Tax=Somion occarium TaxID=3059160 RepID=A0ABP1E0A3_9APHY
MYAGKITSARDAQVSRWVGVSAVTFLVYDVLINISDEVEYVWRVPRTWAYWAYLYVRHFAMIALASLLILATNEHNRLGFSSGTCRGWIIYESFLSISLVLLVEAILMIRIYAIFARSKRLLQILSLLFIAECVVSVTGQAFSIINLSFSLELGCVVTSTPPAYMASWIAPLTFQTILFVLTIFKCFVTMTKKTGSDSVLFIFVRDGIWAYALMFAVMLLNLLMFQLKASPLAPLCFKWALSIISFCGSHVLLNMRRLHARINAIPPSSPMISTQPDEFTLTTYTAGQFNGSTDSVPRTRLDRSNS